MGIAFRYGMRRLAFTSELAPLLTGTDLLSRRELASTVGKISWALRVRGEFRCRHEWLSSMASHIGAATDDWRTFYRMSSEEIRLLRGYAAGRDENPWIPCEPLRPFSSVVAAVDASTGSGLAGRLSAA